MTSSDERQDDFTNIAPVAPAAQSIPTQHPSQPSLDTRPSALSLPKNRSTSALLSQSSSNSSLAAQANRIRASFDAASSADYGQLRSPILHDRETGLHRIRQYPYRTPSSPPSPNVSTTNLAVPSRQSSITLQSGPSSPTLPFSEDLSRFPSESLHSFSFARQSEDHWRNRQNVLKRSIDFMRDRLGWAGNTPRIAEAQAKLSGDQELLAMMELLQRANILGPEGLSRGLGIDPGPLTGPAHMTSENLFEKSFLPLDSLQVESPTAVGSPDTEIADMPTEATLSAIHSAAKPPPRGNEIQPGMDVLARTPTEDRASASSVSKLQDRRSTLKRTYTDTTGISLQHRLTEALAQPYIATENLQSGPYILSPPNALTTQPPGPKTHAPSLAPSGAPHGHGSRNAPAAQAIFTTEAQSPWTITAANDLACLVFGVTRAEVRKLGIMEVIQEHRRKWLEERLRNPDSGTQHRPKVSPSQSRRPSQNNSGMYMGSGVTAKLLSKPPSRETYKSRRANTENGTQSSTPLAAPLNHEKSGSRGVLLCGDVVPIQKRNGAVGSASLWVKEKKGGLIWVLEEVAEDVAFLTVDEIGSVTKGTGDVEAIWVLERVRRGMDVTRLIPTFPKLAGTNTGALDYDAVARLKRFTARTSNSISIPITVEQLHGESTFRVSSFPHIAGMMVLNSDTLRISSSNSVFSAALFGYSSPDGLAITDLIPGFDKILHVMTDEDQIRMVDGIVIPEHSFRRARALLALREGRANAAAIFLRPSGLPAKHRDGAEIMIDVQMRVVQSDRDPICAENVIEEGNEHASSGSEIVYALWITYSRQLHAVNHGIGPVTPLVSRPGTPPHQPSPGQSSPITHGELADSDGTPARTDSPAGAGLLTQQLTQASETLNSLTGPDDSEPHEHPSPAAVAAGVKVIKKKRIDDFVILEEMGQGAYGQVKLARYNTSSAQKMVIKYVTKRRILVDTWHRDRRLGTVPLEIHVLDYLRRDGLCHANIVEMADFFEDDVNYYIEMLPHGLPGMDLFDYIELRVTMDERECRKIFRQVAEALRHLHLEAKVVHRDIKDENVVLDADGRVKLVDFGSAAYIRNGPFDVFVGTIDYAAPEVLRGEPYHGREQDVWALGILLYTIVYKENPFYSIDEIMDRDLRVPYVLSELCIDLIRCMLDRDVLRRVGIQAVLDHPWCMVVDPEEE